MFAHECPLSKKKKKIPTFSLCGNCKTRPTASVENCRTYRTPSVENCNEENSNHIPLSHESTHTLKPLYYYYYK